MRKVKLTVLSLLALTTMSLASCTGAQGEKGDKGDQGEQGIQGEPGEPGEPGEDGSFWYSGEGVPSSDLGKEGDMYLDTATSDVYQKGADGWTKIANIKGDDGEDGEDGEDGKNGSNGANGKTAWSNTILPSEGGYVTPSVGSALVGEAVTFTITPLENYVLTSLSLNNEEVTPTLSEDKASYTYETTMVEHGFVVAASFDAANSGSGYVDGIKYNNVVKDAYGNVISYSGKVDNATEFAGGSGSVEDPLQISDAEMFTSENLNETGESNFILNNDITLTTSLPLVTQPGDDGVKETNLDLGGHSLTTLGSTVELKNKDVLNIENGTLTIPTAGEKAAIAANEGSSISLDNVILNAGSGIGIWDSAISVNVTNTTINADTFGISTNASNWEEAENIEINISDSTISTLNDTSGDNTAVLININADVNIKNSTLEGARQALVVRSGNVDVKKSTIKYNTRFSVDGSDPVGEYDGDYYGDHPWGEGNRVATAGIVVGDYQNSAYEAPCNLNLTEVKFVEETYTSSGESTFADFDTPNKEKLYQLYINGEEKSTPATVKMDSKTYSSFDEDRIFINEYGSLIVDGVNERVVGDNVFINGTLYDHATYKDNNGVYELINDPANKVSELDIKFSDGSGTKEDPLIVSSSDELLILNNIDTIFEVSHKKVYVKLADSFDTLSLLEPIELRGKTDVAIDFNNKNVVLGSSAIFDLFDESNLTIDGDPIFSLNLDEEDPNITEYAYYFRLKSNSQLTINNGTYNEHMTAVQLADNSKAYINGGTYLAPMVYSNRYYTLNLIDGCNGEFYVSGGVFEMYDPSNSLSENPTENFLADGYTVESSLAEDGVTTIYKVVPIE